MLSVILPAPERLGPAGARRRRRSAGRAWPPGWSWCSSLQHPDEPLPAWLTAPFGWVQMVPRPSWTTMTDARAAGVLHARAPLVVFCEDHCYPVDGWAEALVAAHQAPWAAVGPAILNANPVDAGQLGEPLGIEYGPWLHPVSAGRLRACARSQQLLQAIGAAGVRRSAARDDGSRERPALGPPAARAWRSRWSRPLGPVTRISRGSGRRSCSGSAAAGLFAASRARAGRCGAGRCTPSARPALPIRAHVARAARSPARAATARPRRGLSPGHLRAAVVDAVGEAVGYAVGAGDQSRRLSAIEHDRGRFMSARDRRARRADDRRPCDYRHRADPRTSRGRRRAWSARCRHSTCPTASGSR